MSFRQKNERDIDSNESYFSAFYKNTKIMRFFFEFIGSRQVSSRKTRDTLIIKD